ncbi:hypothetical protein IFO70_28720 [Phormidium tenue FACHB-886]|nr:hypothetical protein [Phormidium tenue FACHB-886]
MKSTVYWSTLFASIALCSFSNRAMAQTAPTTPIAPQPNLSNPPAVQPAERTAPAPAQTTPASQSPTNPVAQEAPLQCPAGYFASAFSDVTPDHWAYEAVNRLASTESRCFPVSPPSSS